LHYRGKTTSKKPYTRNKTQQAKQKITNKIKVKYKAIALVVSL